MGDDVNKCLELKDSTSWELANYQYFFSDYTEKNAKTPKMMHEEKDKVISELFRGLIICMDNQTKLAALEAVPIKSVNSEN